MAAKWQKKFKGGSHQKVTSFKGGVLKSDLKYKGGGEVKNFKMEVTSFMNGPHAKIVGGSSHWDHQ